MKTVRMASVLIAWVDHDIDLSACECISLQLDTVGADARKKRS